MFSFLKFSLFETLFPDGITASSPHLIVLYYVLILLIPLAIGYLLGSVNSAILISKIFYHDDIREHGSGNGGATNVMRTFGNRAALATFGLDFLKTAIAVFLGALLLGEDGSYVAGLGAVIGHLFPVFFHFRGGKGVTCAAALVCCTEPILFLILIVIFVLIVLGTRFISLGSVMCMILYPLLLNRMYVLLHHTEGEPVIPMLVSFLLMVMIVVKHWENIRRLMKGEESRFSFKKSVKRTQTDEEPGEESQEESK